MSDSGIAVDEEHKHRGRSTALLLKVSRWDVPCTQIVVLHGVARERSTSASAGGILPPVYAGDIAGNSCAVSGARPRGPGEHRAPEPQPEPWWELTEAA